VPVNFEQNMKIVISLDYRVTIPGDWKGNCVGLRGTDKKDLTCTAVREKNEIHLTDAVATKDIIPDVIEFVIEGL
jgi:hypothetical protein